MNIENDENFFDLEILKNIVKSKEQEKLKDNKTLKKLICIYKLENNLSELKKFFKELVDKKDAKCAYALGIIYKIEENKEKAKKYFKCAVSLGYEEAIVLLENYYEKNDLEFKKLLEEQLKLKNRYVISVLEKLYIDADKEKIKEIYKKGVDLEDIYSINKLADIFVEENNIEKAKILYEQGLKLRSAYSAEKLGIFYQEQGELEKATQMYEQGVELNSITCIEKLDFIYKKNCLEKREKILKKGVESGSLYAIDEIKKIYKNDERKLNEIKKKIEEVRMKKICYQLLEICINQKMK